MGDIRELAGTKVFIEPSFEDKNRQKEQNEDNAKYNKKQYDFLNKQVGGNPFVLDNKEVLNEEAANAYTSNYKKMQSLQQKPLYNEDGKYQTSYEGEKLLNLIRNKKLSQESVFRVLQDGERKFTTKGGQTTELSDDEVVFLQGKYKGDKPTKDLADALDLHNAETQAYKLKTSNTTEPHYDNTKKVLPQKNPNKPKDSSLMQDLIESTPVGKLLSTGAKAIGTFIDKADTAVDISNTREYKELVNLSKEFVVYDSKTKKAKIQDVQVLDSLKKQMDIRFHNFTSSYISKKSEDEKAILKSDRTGSPLWDGLSPAFRNVLGWFTNMDLASAENVAITNAYLQANQQWFTLRGLVENGRKEIDFDIGPDAQDWIQYNMERFTQTILSPLEALVFGNNHAKNAILFNEISTRGQKDIIKEVLYKKGLSQKEIEELEKADGGWLNTIHKGTGELSSLLADFTPLGRFNMVTKGVNYTYDALRYTNKIHKALAQTQKVNSILSRIDKSSKIQTKVNSIISAMSPKLGLRTGFQATSGKVFDWNEKIIRQSAKNYELFGSPWQNTGSAVVGGFLSYIFRLDPTATPDEALNSLESMAVLAGGSEFLARILGNSIRVLGPMLNRYLKNGVNPAKAEEYLLNSQVASYALNQMTTGSLINAGYGLHKYGDSYDWERFTIDLMGNAGIFGRSAYAGSKRAMQVKSDMAWEAKYPSKEKTVSVAMPEVKALLENRNRDIEGKTDEELIEMVNAQDGLQAELGTESDNTVKLKYMVNPSLGDFVSANLKEKNAEPTMRNLVGIIKNKRIKNLTKAQKELFDAIENDPKADIPVLFEDNPDDLAGSVAYDAERNAIVFNTNRPKSKDELNMYTVAKAIQHEANHRFVVPRYRNNEAYKKEVDQFYAQVDELLYETTDKGVELKPEIKTELANWGIEEQVGYAMQNPEELMAAFSQNTKFIQWLLKKNFKTSSNKTVKNIFTTLIKKAFGRDMVNYKLFETFRELTKESFDVEDLPVKEQENLSEIFRQEVIEPQPITPTVESEYEKNTMKTVGNLMSLNNYLRLKKHQAKEARKQKGRDREYEQELINLEDYYNSLPEQIEKQLELEKAQAYEKELISLEEYYKGIPGEETPVAKSELEESFQNLAEKNLSSYLGDSHFKEKNGKPKILYYTSTNDIKYFESYSNEPTESGETRKNYGLHLSTNYKRVLPGQTPKAKSVKEGESLYLLVSRASNPIVIKSTKAGNIVKDKYGKEIKKLTYKFQDVSNIDFIDKESHGKYLRLGYDSINYNNGEKVVILNPTHDVKSIFNKGAYNPSDPNILGIDESTLSEERPTIQTKKVPDSWRLKKVISGMQTGVDQLGLQVAKKMDYEIGGTAPAKFYTEKGKDPKFAKEHNVDEISKERKELIEQYLKDRDIPSNFYTVRTFANVQDSDGTVYFTEAKNSAGLMATKKYAEMLGKPFIVNPDSETLKKFIKENGIETLNIAGNRDSHMSKSYKDFVSKVLEAAFTTEKYDIPNTEQKVLTEIKNSELSRVLELSKEYDLMDEDFDNSEEATNTANQQKADDKLGSLFREAGYINSQDFYDANIDKPFAEIKKNVINKLVSAHPYIDKNLIESKAKYIALRVSNLEKIQPLFIRLLKEKGVIIEGSIEEETNPRDITGNLIQAYAGKMARYDLFANEILDWIRKNPTGTPADTILEEIFTSKKYYTKSAMVNMDTGVKVNEMIPLDILEAHGYYPLKENTFLYSYTLKKIANTYYDKATHYSLDTTEPEYKAIRDAMYTTALKFFLDSAYPWGGTKPKDIDKIINLIDYNKVIDWIEKDDGWYNATREILKDLPPEIAKQLQDILIKYTRNNYNKADPLYKNILAGIEDIMSFMVDNGGAGRVQMNERDKANEEKFTFKYWPIKTDNNTVRIPSIDIFKEYLGPEQIDNFDETLKGMGLVQKGDQIYKKVAVMDEWLSTDDAGNTINPELYAFLNDRIMDGAERTINPAYHRLITKVINGRGMISTIKQHGSGKGIIEKTASHYEYHSPFFKDRHPYAYEFLKKAKHRVVQIAGTSSFKNKSYDELYLTEALTMPMGKGYIRRTAEGRWIDAGTIENDGSFRSDPELFIAEREYAREVLRRGIIPDTVIIEVPFTGPEGQSFLYKSHKARLKPVSTAFDRVPGIFQDSFYLGANSKPWFNFADANLKRHVSTWGSIIKLRGLMDEVFKQNLAQANIYPMQKKHFSDEVLAEAGQVIQIVAMKLASEYENTKSDKSFIVNYSPRTAQAILHSALDERGYVIPSKLDLVSFALSGVLAADWFQPPGFNTFLGYLGKEYIDNAMLNRIDGVNLVLQPSGFDAQYLDEALYLTERDIRAEAGKAYASNEDKETLIEEYVDKKLAHYRKIAKVMEAKYFYPSGELSEELPGIIVSRDALDELNRNNRLIGMPEVQLGSQIMAGAIPATGLNTMIGAVVAGITSQPGVIRMNRKMQAEVLGKDGDFDKMFLASVPAEIINVLNLNKTYKGELSDGIAELRKKDKQIVEGTGLREINMLDFPYQDFNSKPQSRDNIYNRLQSGAQTDIIIGTKNKIGMALQNMYALGSTITDKGGGVIQKGNRTIFRLGKYAKRTVKVSDKEYYTIGFDFGFGKEESMKESYIAEQGVDMYNPNHIQKVKSQHIAIVETVYREYDKNNVDVSKKGNFRLTEKETEVLMNLIDYLGSTKAASEVRKAISFARQKQGLDKYREQEQASTPAKVIRLMKEQVLKNNSLNSVTRSSLESNAPELNNLDINNRLSRKMIKHITESLKDVVKEAVKAVKLSENDKDLKNNLASVFSYITGRFPEQERGDNIYNVSEENPLVVIPRAESRGADNWQNRVYLTNLKDIFNRFRTLPGKIVLSENPYYKTTLEEGIIKYRNSEGELVSSYIDELTMKEIGLKSYDIRKVINDNGTISEDMTEVYDWLYNPRIQTGFMYDKAMSTKDLSELKVKAVINVAKYLEDVYKLPANDMMTWLGLSELDSDSVISKGGRGEVGGSVLLSKRIYGKSAKAAEQKQKEMERLRKKVDLSFFTNEKEKAAAVEHLFGDRYRYNIMDIVAMFKKEGHDLEIPTAHGKVKIEEGIVNFLNNLGDSKRDYYGLQDQTLTPLNTFKISDLIPGSNWWRMPFIPRLKQAKTRSVEALAKAIKYGWISLGDVVGEDKNLPLPEIMRKYPDQIHNNVVVPLLKALSTHPKLLEAQNKEEINNLMTELLYAFDPSTIKMAEATYNSIEGGESNVYLAKVKLLEELFTQIDDNMDKGRRQGDRRANGFFHPFLSQSAFALLNDWSREKKYYPPDYSYMSNFEVENGQIKNKGDFTVSTILSRATELPFIATLFPKAYIDYIRPLSVIRASMDRIMAEINDPVTAKEFDDITHKRIPLKNIAGLKNFEFLDNIKVSSTLNLKNNIENVLFTMPDGAIFDGASYDAIADIIQNEFNRWLPENSKKDVLPFDIKPEIKVYLKLKQIANNQANRLVALAEQVKIQAFNMKGENSLYKLIPKLDENGEILINENGEPDFEPGVDSLYDEILHMANKLQNGKVKDLVDMMEKTSLTTEQATDLVNDIIASSDKDYKEQENRRLLKHNFMDMLYEQNIPFIDKETTGTLFHLGKSKGENVLVSEPDEHWEEGEDKKNWSPSVDMWRDTLTREIASKDFISPEKEQEVKEGILDDLFRQQEIAINKAYKNDNTGISKNDFINSLDFIPIRYMDFGEQMALVQPIYDYIDNLAYLSAETTKFWYELATRLEIPGYGKPFHQLSGSEKRDLRHTAKSIIIGTMNNFIKQMLDYKNVMDVNFMFAKTDLTLGNVFEDGNWKLKLLDNNMLTRDLNFNKVIEAYADLVEKPELKKESFSTGVDNFSDSITSFMNRAMNKVENENLMDYVHSSTESNAEAFNYVSQQIQTNQGKKIFYGFGEESKVNVSEVKALADNAETAHFTRPGTNIMINYMDSNGTPQVLGGDVIGTVRRKRTTEKYMEENEEGEMPTVETNESYVVVYNPIENKMNLIRTDHISHISLGKIYENTLNKALMQKKHKVYARYADKILNDLAKGELETKGYFFHEANWSNMQEINGRFLPGKGGHGNWKEVSTADSYSPVPWDNADNRGLMNWMKQISNLEYDIKNDFDKSTIIQALQDISIGIRVGMEYLGLNHLAKMGLGLLVLNGELIKKGFAGFASRWGTISIGNVFVTSSALINQYPDLAAYDNAGNPMPINQAKAMWSGLGQSLKQIAKVYNMESKAEFGPDVILPSNESFRRAALGSSTEIAQADEMMLRNKAIMAEAKRATYKDIRKFQKITKAFDVVYKELDREMLLDKDNLEKVEKQINDIATKYKNLHQIGNIKVVEGPRGTLIPTVDGYPVNEYMKFDMDMMDALLYMASGKGFAQEKEYRSTRIAFNESRNHYKRMAERYKKFNMDKGDYIELGNNIMQEMEFETIKMTKNIGLYSDKSYQKYSFLAKHQDMFKNFRKERQLDRTAYFKERVAFEEMYKLLINNDDGFRKALASAGIPFIPFGGSFMYSPTQEAINQLGTVPVIALRMGLPWFLRAGLFNFITSWLKSDFSDAFQRVTDDIFFESQTYARMLIQFLTGIINSLAMPGMQPWPERKDANDNPIKLKSDDWVDVVTRGGNDIVEVIGSFLGYSPMETDAGLSPVKMALWGLHNYYLASKADTYYIPDKYREQVRIKKFNDLISPFTSITGTKPISALIEETAIKNTRKE